MLREPAATNGAAPERNIRVEPKPAKAKAAKKPQTTKPTKTGKPAKPAKASKNGKGKKAPAGSKSAKSKSKRAGDSARAHRPLPARRPQGRPRQAAALEDTQVGALRTNTRSVSGSDTSSRRPWRVWPDLCSLCVSK